MLGNSIVAAIAIRSLARSTATAPFTLIRQHHAAFLPSAPTLPKSISIPSRSAPKFCTTSVPGLGTGALNPRSYDILATATSPFTLIRQYHAASLPSASTLPKSIPILNRLSSPFFTTSVRGLQSGALNDWSHEISPPINWGVFSVVPKKKAFMIERFGSYLKTLPSGIHFLIPLVDRIAHVYSLEEEAIPIPGLYVMTLDKVDILIDGVLYVKVVDPLLAFYGVVNSRYTVFAYAQSVIRSAVGNLTLDKILEERERRTLVEKIVDISLTEVRAAMEMIAEAERIKRAAMKTMAEAEQIKRAAMEMETEAELKKRPVALREREKWTVRIVSCFVAFALSEMVVQMLK